MNLVDRFLRERGLVAANVFPSSFHPCSNFANTRGEKMCEIKLSQRISLRKAFLDFLEPFAENVCLSAQIKLSQVPASLAATRAPGHGTFRESVLDRCA